jgi:5'-methylthioadenosine phosphorylase
MARAEIGVIGGTGLYRMEQLKDVEEVRLSTPFGNPSDAFIIGTLHDRRVAFLPRHGRGHTISPSEINFRANIYAMKMLGVEWIIASSACGSFKEELSPGTIVLIDQFYDRTMARGDRKTFFEGGIVTHIQFADPICPNLSEILYEAGRKVGARVVKGGTYLNMEGPAFSTRAESLVHKSWGIDVIGMTNLFEARLAREAEIHMATLALVTDYDCWHESHEDVDIGMVIRTVNENAEAFRRIVIEAVGRIPKEPVEDVCSTALATAIFTRPEHIPAEAKKRLAAITGKYLK